MNPRRRSRKVAASLALALLCAAMGAPAQTIYKQVDAAGRVTFTDRPDASLPALAMASPVSMANPVPESPKPAARAGLLSPRHAASIDANEAARRLAQAELMRSEGADPLPGEQTHGAAGLVPNQRYFQRQEKLRVLVERARQRANETRLPLLAQR
jgi:uncharacterized protein DUF4124